MSIIGRRAGVKQPANLVFPTGLSKDSSTVSQIVISWTNGAGSGGSTEVYMSGSKIATLPRSTTGYTATGLLTNTAYTFWVRHVNGTAYSAASVSKIFSTSLIAPGSFSVAAQPDSRTIKVDWEASGARTEVWRSPDNVSFSQIATVSSFTGTYRDTDLPDGTYYYKIRFATDDATSAYTTVKSDIIDQTVDPPTSFALSVMDENTIHASWALGEAGAKTEVYVSEDDATYTKATTTAASALSYDLTGLKYSTKYYVKVRHLRGSELVSVYTGPENKTTSAYVAPPAKPSGLTLNAPYTDRAGVSWTIGDADSQTKIYRGTSEGSLSLLATVAKTVATYNDDTVVSGTRYYYAVEHFNETTGKYSGRGSVKNILMPSPSLSNQQVSAPIDGTDAALSWDVGVAPREGVVVWLGPWDDGDGDTGGGPYPDGGVTHWITTPHDEPLGFTVRGKHPGVTYPVSIHFPVFLIGAVSGDKLATDSAFWVDVYKDY